MPSLRLRPVTVLDLDWMREHRNQLGTRCWLGNNAVITEEQQQLWFDTGGAGEVQIVDMPPYRDVGIIRVTMNGSLGCVGADVRRGFRGFGLGHVLFGAACDVAVAQGARDLWLRVFVENTPAVKIYLKAGFAFVSGETTSEHREIPGSGRPVLVNYAKMERKAVP